MTLAPRGDPTWLTHSLKRELDFAIPVNPAAMPMAARMRHLAGPLLGAHGQEAARHHGREPALHEADATATGSWRSSRPGSGPTRRRCPANAGTVGFTRHLTHRAVLGISMGGGGAAIFGMRHHDQFDAIAPLGGN